MDPQPCLVETKTIVVPVSGQPPPPPSPSVCRYLWPGGRVVGGPVGEGREPLQCDVSLVILADLHLE